MLGRVMDYLFAQTKAYQNILDMCASLGSQVATLQRQLEEYQVVKAEKEKVNQYLIDKYGMYNYQEFKKRISGLKEDTND